jgi:glycosyltransferase involved in cell wall biosynthesis
MNILIIHNYYSQRGGEDAVFENESKALEQLGHKVIRYSRNNKEIENYSLIKKFKFICSIYSSKKTKKDLNKIISENKIDLAHIHNVFPLITTSIYKVLKKNNIKTIQTLHNYRFLCINAFLYRKNKLCMLCSNGNFLYGLIFRCFKNSYILSALYSTIIKKNQKIFRNYIDGYIALTEFTKNIFVKYGYKNEKFFIKDNGFIDNNVRRKKSGGYFLFLGRISGEKGISFLLEFFKEHGQYKLIVAGDGDQIDFFKKNYNCPNIFFEGFVKGENKTKLIQEAEALIVPSVWYENYPISIVESFSIGIPVIGSKIGGIPYIVKDEENGLLFETNNKVILKEKIDKIYRNYEFRERLGNNARNYYLEKMEMSNNIKILGKIYKKVIYEK